jgi:hypothetical protein
VIKRKETTETLFITPVSGYRMTNHKYNEDIRGEPVETARVNITVK